MPAYLHNLMDAIDSSERSYDKEQIISAYDLPKQRMKGSGGIPAIPIFLIQLP